MRGTHLPPADDAEGTFLQLLRRADELSGDVGGAEGTSGLHLPFRGPDSGLPDAERVSQLASGAATEACVGFVVATVCVEWEA